MKKNVLSLFVMLFVLMSASAVMGAHTATLDLQPEWSPAGQNTDYEMEFNNNGPDGVDEIRIFKNPTYSDFDCVPVTGWTLQEISNFPSTPFGVATDMCWYYTDNPLIGTETFEFSATVPQQGCEWGWYIESRDEQGSGSGDWETWNDTTSVDDDAPSLVKTVTGEQSENCPPGVNEECWVRQDTQITVDITEEGQVCGLSGLDYCKISYILDDDDEYLIMEKDDFDENATSWSHTFSFSEDSKHDLIVECRDVAGNQLYDEEVFRVDDTPPKTTKTYGNPNFTPNGNNDVNDNGYPHFITTGTEITLGATDPEHQDTPDGYDCSVGVDKIYYRWCQKDCYIYEGGDGATIAQCSDTDTPCNCDMDWVEVDGKTTTFTIPEESEHCIEFYAVDELGNVENMNHQCVYVDDTPPRETKKVEDPKEPMCDYRNVSESESVMIGKAGHDPAQFNFVEELGWETLDITQKTKTNGDVEFTIKAPRNLGVSPDNFDLVFDADSDGTPDFLVHWYFEMSKDPQGDSHWTYKENDGGWSSSNLELPTWITANPNAANVDEFTVIIPAEKLGGCGDDFKYALQMILSDEGSEIVGGNHQVTILYPVGAQNIFGDSDDYKQAMINGKDWWLNGDSRVGLDCQDQGPHPSEGEEACYRISFDDPANPDLTADYCGTDFDNNNQNQGYMDGDWCCADVHVGLAYWITFQEESLHGLEYFCRDAVDKKTEVDLEYFRVDMTPPEITKDMLGTEGEDYMGDCPSGTVLDHGDCYVLGGSGVHVDVTDPDTTGRGCAIDNVVCDYTVEWEGSIINEGTFGEEGVDIIFDEDSEHILTINCEDLLGNEMDEDVETFLVDMTPPETKKTYDESMSVVRGGSRWITTGTDITLDASDEKIGVEGIHYMNEWVSNETCEAHPVAPSETPGYKYPVSTGDHVFPSTNEDNKEGTNTYRPGVVGPHVNVVDTDVGEVTLEFVNPLNYVACFEYMTDANTSQATGTPHDYHPDVTNQYPYVCLTDGTQQITLSADMFAEVRLVFGAERDWDFDWTRFDVIPDTSDWSYVDDETVTFNISEESCHIIQYYAVDLFGNVEDVQRQYVIVDDSVPEMTKELGQDKVACDGSEDCHYYIDQDTPITFKCEDVDPHPVDDVTMFIDVYWKETFADDWSEVPDHQFVKNMDEWTFTPHKDSMHKFEYWCVDRLGNQNIHQFEIDVVDTQEPEITTGIEGPTITIGDDVFIDGVTNITVEAFDPEPHPVGEVMCRFDYSVVDGGKLGLDEEGVYMAPPFKVNFPEDSEHHLDIKCKDALGNVATKQEVYLVDKTAPGIYKDYEVLFTDYKEDQTGTFWAKFTDVGKDINGSVSDDGPHKTGINEVKYKVSLVDDEMCKHYMEPCPDETCQYIYGGPYIESEFDCSEASEGDWTTVPEEEWDEFVFSISEESCHMIEIMATDNVEKCNLHRQYVFADDSAPDTDKTVGEPKSSMSDESKRVGAREGYPELDPEGDNICAEGDDKCWDVTLLTPIDMACVDPEPHPSGAVDVCYQVGLDGHDATEKYCDPADMNGDGYCCVDGPVNDFHFIENSTHKLSYYCVDNVGNKDPAKLDVEYFKVRGVPFQIQLNGKWNLISVPVKLSDNSMEEVFAGMENIVDSVWTYDGGSWSVYTPDGVANDDLNTMLPGWGYWVLTNLAEGDSELLTIGGSLFDEAVTPPSKTIVNGWNLIGYYGAEGAPWRDESGNPASPWDPGAVPGYYGPAGNGYTVGEELNSLMPNTWDTSVSSIFGYWQGGFFGLCYPDNMDPGAGYWIHKSDGSEFVPPSCDGNYRWVS